MVCANVVATICSLTAPLSDLRSSHLMVDLTAPSSSTDYSQFSIEVAIKIADQGPTQTVIIIDKVSAVRIIEPWFQSWNHFD